MEACVYIRCSLEMKLSFTAIILYTVGMF